MVSKKLVLAMIVAMCGIGLTAYLANSKGQVTVFGEVIEIKPSSYSIEMNATSIYTKNITVSTTSSDDVTVEIKVLPADYATSKAWGSDFIAYASPSKVTLNSDHPAKVTIVHYGEKAGSYEVKIIAVK